MTQIEIDINDWRSTAHLPLNVWQGFLDAQLPDYVADALQRHLIACPCCQEQLIDLRLQPAPAPSVFPSLVR